MSETKTGISVRQAPLWLAAFAVLSLFACAPAKPTPTPNPFAYMSVPIICESIDWSQMSPPIQGLKNKFFNGAGINRPQAEWTCEKQEETVEYLEQAQELYVEKLGLDEKLAEQAIDRLQRIESTDSGGSKVVANKSTQTLRLSLKSTKSAVHEYGHMVIGTIYSYDSVDGSRTYYHSFNEGLSEFGALLYDPKKASGSYECKDGKVLDYRNSAEAAGTIFSRHPTLFAEAALLNIEKPDGYTDQDLAKKIASGEGSDPKAVLQEFTRTLPQECQ